MCNLSLLMLYAAQVLLVRGPSGFLNLSQAELVSCVVNHTLNEYEYEKV